MNFNISVKGQLTRGQLSKNNENTGNLSQLANCIRFLAIDSVQKANSGHPGMPMGMADIATVLFKEHLKYDPNDPNWFDRDRLIISNGHGSMLLYACLYLSGYKDINIENIKNFRQLNSPTAGHPEFGELAGIETTTGPLSQGLANGVGFAIAEKKLSIKFNKDLINHYTYVFAGDGCLMEGLSHEACSLAAHLKLNKLIVFFDDNSISIDGSTALSVSENTTMRYEAYGWNVISIDGHNHEQISNAILKAKKHNAPTLIACKTKIGYGSPNKESKSSSHGAPLGIEEIELTRKNLHWQHPPFEIPKELLNEWRNFHSRNIKVKNDWLNNNESIINSDKYKNIFKHPFSSKLINLIEEFKDKHIDENTNCATRKASELSIEFFNKQIDNLIGGSADLTGSNNTKAKDMKNYDSSNYDGNYIYYGVREHGMAAIMNGIALHKGLRPYGGTFLVFTDYCRPSIRLSAIMKLPVIYIMSHDSIGLGEDGPTHQPVEHLSSLRAIPGLKVIRPCDIIETIESWQIALESEGPSIIVLTRQNLPLIRKEKVKENLTSKGAYILKNFDEYEATILATGSEVEIAIKASTHLEKENIKVRVISIPCFEIFNSQSKEYKKQILGSKTCFGIEAGVINGWEKYVDEEKFIGMETFGASGPYKELYEHFQISSEHLIKKIKNNINNNN
tara:strand:- start:8087 stop:10120 length:2034 start_codon:yes stop_codon:yes gene_type:complete